jgi:hypothetical protein
MRRRIIALLLLTVLTSLSLFIGGADEAMAASGGGCSGWAGTTTGSGGFGAKACISAPAYGTGRPDGYVRIAWVKYSSCTIKVAGVRVGDRKIMSQASYGCPSFNTSSYYVLAPSFHATSGSYVSIVTITGTILGPHSPNLNLP